MRLGFAAACGVGLLALVSCGKKSATAPFLPPVTFATAQSENVPLTINTFGNCVAISDVTLQAQVTGTLQKFGFPEGATVNAGDVVALIDPSPFQAALEQAQGNLDSAKAQLADNQVNLQRQQQLYKTKTIDLADLQTAEANALQSEGAVESAEAALATAQINLAYCTIKAPVTGKTGIYIVDAGNLVTANQTKLINIQTVSPIYVQFTISENDFDRVRQYFNSGELQVNASLPTVPNLKIPGKLDFIDNSIAPSTGTLSLRATFPNEDSRLWPGLFVHVELVLTILQNAVTIPSPCVMIGQAGPYIFVVNADNTVTQRNVTVGQRRSDFTVITDGVQPGDRIVTAGQLGLVTGMKISPSPYQAPVQK